MNQSNLFNLPIYEPPRDHEGKFTEIVHDPQAQVKRHLESGLSITVSSCYKLYHTHDLRKILTRLRRAGLAIVDRYHREGKFRYKVYSKAKQ